MFILTNELKPSEGYVLDSGKDLGWSFYIEEIKDNYAIIDLYKL